MGFRSRQRHGTKGRLPKPVKIARHPMTEGLTPLSKSARSLYYGGARTVYIDSAEVEAQRLVDLEGLSQEEAAGKMEVSRGTVWRLLHAARMKLAQALTEARPLLILSEENKQISGDPLSPPKSMREQ